MNQGKCHIKMPNNPAKETNKKWRRVQRKYPNVGHLSHN